MLSGKIEEPPHSLVAVPSKNDYSQADMSDDLNTFRESAEGQSPASFRPTQPLDLVTDDQLSNRSSLGEWSELDITAEDSPNIAEGDIVSVASKRIYAIGKEVGKGGMGMVFASSDQACQREVAMKILRREEFLSPGGCERFLKEARITARLEHPNIIPVHEVGLTEQRRIFYTMKYVRGITLTDILLGLRRGEASFIELYPLSRLLNIFQKVCDAVAFAHSRDVIHRDIKPENIMIGDYGEVLVMDWGLSEVMGSPSTAAEQGALRPAEEPRSSLQKETSKDLGRATTRESSNSVQGTPGFIAPERLGPGGFIGDMQSDVYSLGATLYSILTLRAPVGGKDMREVLARILAGDIRPPASFNEAEETARQKERPHCLGGVIPSALSEIAMKALATYPDERYASVKALQADIEDYQLGKVWHLVVEETFLQDDVLDRWDIRGGRHEFRNDGLCVYEGEPQVVVFKGKLPVDVRLEFECHQDAINPASLGCFISGIPAASTVDIPSSGYKFEFGAFDNTVHVLNRVEKQLSLQKAVNPLLRGKKYRVCIERVGARLRASLNEEELFNLVDPDPLSGAERTAVGLVGWRTRTILSRVRIHTLSAPRLTDLLDVAERQFQQGHYEVATALYQEVLDSYPDPERREKARAGQARAIRQEELNQHLLDWRDKLEKAWPSLPFHLRMSNNGLALEIPPACISSLAPVAGIPLTTLAFQNNAVTDLEPLRGMPLVVLNCTGNPVASLEPLSSAPLESVMCEGCRIESLAPLRGKHISLLNCSDNRIPSLEPVGGMPLTFLCCWGNQLDSLEPVRGMKLTTLICSANRIADLEPLRGMPLATLICNGNRMASLEPLRGMPLKELHCGDNQITSLEPLRGSTLKVLGCHANQITSLEPLRGLPLDVVMCGANRLSTISFFSQQPPPQFDFSCDTMPVQEYEFLLNKWRGDFRRAAQVRNLETLIALRRKDLRRLRELAAEWQGRRYLYIPLYKTWEEARVFCEELGGHLLSITSREENDFVASLFPNGCWFWLGLLTTEQGQQWASRDPFVFNNFSDIMQERRPGPKVFIGKWARDGVPGAHNCFMVEWPE